MSDNAHPLNAKYCPNCGTPNIEKQSSKTGGLLSHMGLTRPKYECQNCGWIGFFYLRKDEKSSNDPPLEEQEED